MYLRTTSRRNKDGSRVAYYQLAHNYRHPETRRSTVEIIHNFGRADELDREALVRLCRSIARVCDLEVHDPVQQVEASLVEDGGGLADGLRLEETLELGPLWVIEELWERLGIGPVLRRVQAGKRVRYERALLAMTANRLMKPSSKLGVWDRWLEGVYLPSARGLKLAHMYEAMDLLHEHAAEVEEAVFFKTADLLNLTVDLVFYDATTATFEIDEGDRAAESGEGGLRRFGANSEGVWKPQVKVALAVTREGLPVRSWVFPGHTSDLTTVAEVKRDLRGWKLGRSIFVADAGMNSEENREELARGAGKYILASRVGSLKEVKEEVLTRSGRYQTLSENLQVKEVAVGDGELRRRYILCFNPREAERQGLHRKQVLSELEQEIGSHRSWEATQKWAIDLLASRRYGPYLKVGTRSQVEIDYAAAREREKRDGKWVLITNDDTLSTADAAAGYRGLLVIERCFRALKRTRIRMTPMYHWLPRRIEAHVKICVLSLLIARTAELAAETSWEKIRRALQKVKATRFCTETHHFWQRNEVPPATARTLQALGVKAPKKLLAVEDAA